MKSKKEIREEVKRLWKEYQRLGYDTTTHEDNEAELDLALARYEALSWVFEDEDKEE